MSTAATYPHATGADLIYALVWDVHNTDPITSESFTLISGAADMTIAAGVAVGSTRKFRATGGTAGVYVVRHQVTLTSTQIDSRTVTLNVDNR